jgi:Tfp pilus assembly protein PilZ
MEFAEALSPRRHLRVPLRVETIRPGRVRPRFLGYAENVSESGVFVQCSNPRAFGSRFLMRLHLPGSPPRGICCQAEVIWTRGYSGVHGPCAGMGIRFVEVAEDSQDLLSTFCLESDPVPFPRPCSTAPSD